MNDSVGTSAASTGRGHESSVDFHVIKDSCRRPTIPSVIGATDGDGEQIALSWQCQVD